MACRCAVKTSQKKQRSSLHVGCGDYWKRNKRVHKSQKAIATIIVLLYTALAHATTCNVSSVSPASPTYGQSVTITLSFNPTCSNCQTPGPPSGTITFYSNGSSIGSTSNSSGAPSTSLTVTSLAAGTDELSCSYSGGNGWASGGGGNFAVIVSKASSSTAVSSSASSSTVGQSVTFTATVSGSSGTPTGTVTFLNGSTSLGTGSLSGGHATFTTSSLAVGSYSISASYGGDSNFNSSSSSTITQTVNKANPSTSVTSSINPSVFGQSITFKATISGSGFTPTGSVTFYDGSTSLGSGTLSSGQATFSTAAESVGSHSITAHYSGDSNFNAITSSALTQTVNKATTSASVTSSLNPALPGQTVKFTASISVSSPGAGTPTGTVTFLDGSTSLGTGTLGGLQASFSTSTLSVGTHNITANYGGDSNFLNSSSAVLSQAVTGPAISSLSPTSGPVGTVVTISGANFGSTQGTSTVSFNGTAATPTSWSSTQIVVPVPGGASTGNVVVTAGGVASAGVVFAVLPTPTISSLSPTSGAVGASITITGTNFGSTQGTSTVSFNGTAATPTSWSSTQIVVPVPGGASTGNVVVTVGGVASAGVVFTILPTPTISSLSPTSGAVGASITITGTNFGSTQGSSTVSFNGTAATPTSWSSTSIVVPVPSGATSGNVVVTVGGMASAGVVFTVLPTPTISSLSPISGAAGASITITGTNFGSTQGSSTVSFNGTAATPTSWSSTQIVVPVPGGASTGNVVVTVGGVASAGMLFTVVPAIAGNELTSFVASDGSLHTFYVGSNQHIYHLSWSSASSWQSQDVTATLSGSNLAAVGSPLTSFFKSDGTYHVAYLDGSSHINELVYASGTWSDQDATAASTATVTASANSQLTSFADAAGDHIYYLASTQHEYQLLWNGSSWANQDLTALSGTTVLAASGSVLSSFSLNDGSEHSFYIGANQHVYQMLYLSGKGYFNQDLTETAALDLADGPCAPQNGTCYASVTTTVGFGANGSYNFLTVTSNVACNTATFGDPAPGVTKACYYVNTPFPVAASGSELTSFNDGAGDHVYYLDSAGHNHQLTLEGDPGDITQPWVDEDQTEDASTSVVAIAGSALTSFATSDGREHLFYIDTNHHVDQMLYGVALWTNQDLTAASGASQTAAGNSGLTGFGNSGGYTTSVQYFDSTGHINQLSMCGSNTWQDLDLTAIVTGGGVAPTVSSLSSSSGAVGSTVTITGTNFGACQGGSTITFNGTLATPTNWSDTSITVPVPAGATTGNVVVTVNGLGSTGISFAVAPAIASLSPSSAIVGATVTINGTTFGSIQGSSIVTFNGTVAMPTSWSDTQIMVPVPNGATSGPIVVTVGGLSSNSLSFLVNLNISGLSVPVGAVGTPVTIIGGGFGLVQGTVTFNGTAATSITSWTPSAIVATVPTGATTGNVVVTAGGVASNGVPFTVVAMPSITSLSPTSGSPSTVVTITGSNFGATQGTSAVLFNGTPSAPTSWNPTTIVVPVPATASSGPVVVVVDSLQSNGITFIDVSAPIITTITPTSGTDGTSVTINGSLFGASQGSSTVTFNGVASVPTIWNANGTQIVVPAPSSVTTGPVVVTVNGIASNGITFVANPVVTGLSPTSGGIGTEVTIAGRNFGSTVPTVTFNGVAAAPLSWTASSIVVPVPSGATSGNVVVTVGGVSSNAQSFTVTSAPGISSISPTSANVGALVTIKGYGFGATQGANSMVTFSGISAVVKTWSANLIVAAVPQGGVGPVVVIVNQQPSNAVMLSLKSGAPTITSLSPSQGPPQMGFAIVITNIDPVVVGSLTVTVGDTVAPILSTQTSTDGNSFALIVQVPVGSPLGNVAVVVTTPGPLSQQTNALQFNVIPTFGCTLP